jgi:hypothetical protein
LARLLQFVSGLVITRFAQAFGLGREIGGVVVIGRDLIIQILANPTRGEMKGYNKKGAG